jgi:hypothetical protein
MESNQTLTTSYLGSASINGVPRINRDGYRTDGGYQDSTDTQTAYFGRVVSRVLGTSDKALFMGAPSNSTYAGILINEEQMQQNSPARPNYLLATEPATFVYWGELWVKEYKAASGNIIAPVVGASVSYDDTTGQISYFAAGGSAGTGQTAISNATVIRTDAKYGTLIFLR